MNRRNFCKVVTSSSLLALGGCSSPTLNRVASENVCVDDRNGSRYRIHSDYELTAPPSLEMPVQEPKSEINVGLIGVGQRGGVHLNILSNFDFINIVAICDLREEKLVEGNAVLAGKSRPPARPYYSGPEVYRDMLEHESLDLVVISTPWETHVPMSLNAMRSGCNVGVEVPAALTVDECWQLVDAAEKNSRYLTMLENVNYFRNELMVLSAVRAGAIGTPVHAECAYLHDLRFNLLSPERNYPEHWRVDHHRMRNGNLYPTHGLGPISNYLDVNRGNRFESLISMSSKAVSLGEYAKTHYPGAFQADNFRCGDYSSSILKTVRGETTYLSFSTATPRPYSRINLLQGSKGVISGFPERYYLDTGKGHKWMEIEELYTEYEHPIWKRWQSELSRFPAIGHDGGDTVMWHHILMDLLEGISPSMTVYDAVNLSVVSNLTEVSNMLGGAPVEFPDFTRGNWQRWVAQNYLA